MKITVEDKDRDPIFVECNTAIVIPVSDGRVVAPTIARIKDFNDLMCAYVELENILLAVIKQERETYGKHSNASERVILDRIKQTNTKDGEVH